MKSQRETDHSFPADVLVSSGSPARSRGEDDDSGRLQRAIDATPGGVVAIGAGIYELAAPLRICNGCSLLLHKAAILRAVREMDFLVTYDGARVVADDYHYEPGRMPTDMNPFIVGGVFDGNGLASCICLNNYHHFTMRDLVCLNGRRYGLRVGETGHGYELIAGNLYCRTTMSGLAGNVGISSTEGDSHYTDCIVVDYTVGMEMLGGGSNRLTRCHVWGGPVPPIRPGEPPEMLKDSICYRLKSADVLLRDCYADTGKTGYLVDTDARLCSCSYYNNWKFGLDDVTCIRHVGGRLLVSEGYFTQTSPKATLYDGDPSTAIFGDNLINGKTLAWPKLPRLRARGERQSRGVRSE